MNNPEIIIVPAFFGSAAYIVWVLAGTAQRTRRMRMIAEFNKGLLDRFGSVKDFGEFVQTEAGARFLRDLAAEPVSTGPHDRILRAAQFAAVLTCLGLGLLAFVFFSPEFPDGPRATLTGFGVISFALGVGFAVSAVASYRLSAVLGLFRSYEPAVRAES